MNNENEEKILDELSNKTYIFSINVISFAKTLQKSGFDKQIVDNFVVLSGTIADIILDTVELKKKNEIIANLEKSSTFAKKLFELFQNFKAEGSLLNEKVDLQIDNQLIMKQINELLLKYNTK